MCRRGTNLGDEIDDRGGQVGEALEQADDAEAHEERVERQPVQGQARPDGACEGQAGKNKHRLFRPQQGRPFGDCLLLSALLHRASTAAGHTVEQ